MAKRVRGSVRPGQRRPIERKSVSSASTASTASRPSGLSQTEIDRAAELEAQLLAEERAAEDARRRTRERAAREVTPAAAGSLAEIEAKEYAYVARDLRRIGRIAVVLFVVLIAIYFIVDVGRVVTIG